MSCTSQLSHRPSSLRHLSTLEGSRCLDAVPGNQCAGVGRWAVVECVDCALCSKCARCGVVRTDFKV